MSNIIETDRLILRPPIADDLDAWADFMSNEEDARFIGGVMDRAMSWRALMTMIGSWTAHGVGMFSVIEKSSNEWLGRIGPWYPEAWLGTEVGWGLKSSAQGKGYAIEAAIASMDYAVDALGWTKIVHTIDKENTPSFKLAKRLGSALLEEDVFLPKPFDENLVDVWGQSAERWKSNRENLIKSLQR
ncbi:GNAT family N-acetyltransferase [Hirschia maritima]|uniref:GNAT family N-acetyltransferase n=1 Tax=Hirschia maritima TaxID=1121961 RepID=UPI000373CF2D|nr:GNAT family N-acetyltransferase [Hirschia maritima]